MKNYLMKLGAWYVVCFLIISVLIAVTTLDLTYVNPVNWHPGGRILFLFFVPFVMGPPS